MSRYDHAPTSTASDPAPAPRGGGSPGKRTLTQGLQPRPVADFYALGSDIPDTRSTIDTKVDTGPDLTDAQIATAKRRNPRWIAKTKVAAHVFSTAPVDSAAFAFDVAALQARHPGLRVDGIAGPKTIAAVTGGQGQHDGERAITDADGDMIPDVADGSRAITDADGDMIPDAGEGSRAITDADGEIIPDAADGSRAITDVDGDMLPDADPFAHDDPFGMHLIGRR